MLDFLPYFQIIIGLYISFCFEKLIQSLLWSEEFTNGLTLFYHDWSTLAWYKKDGEEEQILKNRIEQSIKGYVSRTKKLGLFMLVSVSTMLLSYCWTGHHMERNDQFMLAYLRGLHFQRPPYTQSKLVRCVKGRVLDVAVDIRKGSPTYGKHVAVELTEDNHRQFFIPKGFAHGFAVLSETAVFQYKCDNFYHPEADGGISILDDTLGIDWRIPTEHANLSEKDTKHKMLKDFDSPFDINVDLYK